MFVGDDKAVGTDDKTAADVLVDLSSVPTALLERIRKIKWIDLNEATGLGSLRHADGHDGWQSVLNHFGDDGLFVDDGLFLGWNGRIGR
ncbi:hypothetical protein M1328_00170 [Patescibacteria group bacterium]|nr:hypothetical protein [Patescibacteria group bacterium]